MCCHLALQQKCLIFVLRTRVDLFFIPNAKSWQKISFALLFGLCQMGKKFSKNSTNANRRKCLQMTWVPLFERWVWRWNPTSWRSGPILWTKMVSSAFILPLYYYDRCRRYTLCESDPKALSLSPEICEGHTPCGVLSRYLWTQSFHFRSLE